MATAASHGESGDQAGPEALAMDVPGASLEAVTDAVSSTNEPPGMDRQAPSLSKLQPEKLNPRKRKRTQRDQGDMATRPQADVDTENYRSSPNYQLVQSSADTHFAAKLGPTLLSDISGRQVVNSIVRKLVEGA